MNDFQILREIARKLAVFFLFAAIFLALQGFILLVGLRELVWIFPIGVTAALAVEYIRKNRE